MRDLSESLKRIAERVAAEDVPDAAERSDGQETGETADDAAWVERTEDSVRFPVREGDSASTESTVRADTPDLGSEDVESVSFDIVDGAILHADFDDFLVPDADIDDGLTIAQIIDGDDGGALPEEDLISEQIIGGEIAWRGNFLNLEVVECRLPNGHIKTRDILRHPGACGIVALDDKGRILIEHQYRVAAERLVREIPAGKLDPGEDAEACARRELEEETGYRAGKLQYLLPYAPALGYSDEIIHLFLATELEKGDARPDDDEFLAFEWVPLKELLQDVLAGRIEDSKTIIAVLLVHTLLTSEPESEPEA